MDYVVVDGDVDEGVEDLGEEDGVGRNVYVVIYFYILKIVLCMILSVVSDSVIG